MFAWSFVAERRAQAWGSMGLELNSSLQSVAGSWRRWRRFLWQQDLLLMAGFNPSSVLLQVSVSSGVYEAVLWLWGLQGLPSTLPAVQPSPAQPGPRGAQPGSIPWGPPSHGHCCLGAMLMLRLRMSTLGHSCAQLVPTSLSPPQTPDLALPYPPLHSAAPCPLYVPFLGP